MLTPKAKEFFRRRLPDEKRAICRAAGISRQWLYNLMSDTRKKYSPAVAVKIEKATNGAVKREDMLPEVDWRLFK